MSIYSDPLPSEALPSDLLTLRSLVAAANGLLKICKTKGILLLMSSFILLGGCAKTQEPAATSMEEIVFRPDGVLDFVRADSSISARIFIEIAESPEAQAQGLMYRRSLPEKGGMLFIDPAPSMRSFWMKNTPLALDIIFVNDQGEVVNIVKRTTPYSEEHILSTGPAQYVVEVRAGFTDKFNITDTDRVSWERRTF